MHSLRECHPAFLAHDASKQLRERPVKARMRQSAYVESIADDRAQRMREKRPEVGLALVEGDHVHATTFLCEKPEHRVHGPLAPNAGDLGESLANEGRVPV